jgi:hypothetical protein
MDLNILAGVLEAIEEELNRKRRGPGMLWHGKRHPLLKLDFRNGDDQHDQLVITIDMPNTRLRVYHNTTRLLEYELNNPAELDRLMKLIHQLRPR